MWSTYGAEGDECAVRAYWWCWAGVCSAFHYGKYDLDDNACIVHCDGTKESTASNAREYCGSEGEGDGNCEQVCGCSSQCDELDGTSIYFVKGWCAGRNPPSVLDGIRLNGLPAPPTAFIGAYLPFHPAGRPFQRFHQTYSAT